jgi:hypothetical protein
MPIETVIAVTAITLAFAGFAAALAWADFQTRNIGR